MRRAFSLVELVLVVAIMITVAAIAAPRYASASTRYRADAAMRRVAADLEYASETARHTSSDVTVTFDPVAHSYTVSGVAGLRDAADAYVVELAGAPYFAALGTLQLDAPLISDATDAIVFDGHGRPDGAGKLFITAGSETRSVAVAASGTVTTSS
jgi:Tfp pilus assembly protein FimT